MAVRADEVTPGEFFMAEGQELRKVFRVATDDRGITCVWYQCKAAAVSGQPLLFGHTQANPPTLDRFIAGCAYRLSSPELDELRRRGILLRYE